jgi:endonuclease/exonuclease/phosphatase family metal-dependent hydrolase
MTLCSPTAGITVMRPGRIEVSAIASVAGPGLALATKAADRMSARLIELEGTPSARRVNDQSNPQKKSPTGLRRRVRILTYSNLESCLSQCQSDKGGSDMLARTFRVLLVLVGIALASAEPASAQACSDGKCIRIGSYNIRLFATPSAWAKTQAQIDKLADRIAKPDQANLDVVVLEEINKNGENWKGPQGLRRILSDRGYEVAFEGTFGGDSPDRPQYVILLYRRDTIAFVFGSAGEINIPTTFDDGSCRYPSLRPPATALFKAAKGTFAFRVVGVHLKSKTPVEGSPDGCDTTIRTFQGKQIVDYIAKLKIEKGETNVITVGDLNAKFTDKEYESFEKAGFKSLMTATCSMATKKDCSYVGSRAELIDHIVVPSSLAQAVTDSGTVMNVGDLTNYLGTQSDHVPVWASFRIY